jgi:hypothetical protein
VDGTDGTRLRAILEVDMPTKKIVHFAIALGVALSPSKTPYATASSYHE